MKNTTAVLAWLLVMVPFVSAQEGPRADSILWHSALSPVLASLDLFNANYLIGREVTTDLYLINDSWHNAQIHVDLLLTEACPQFLPEAKCFDAPLAKWSFEFELPSDTVRQTPVTWKLPERAGCYWLTARTTGIAGRPVLSQRFVRGVQPPKLPLAARQRTFRVPLIGSRVKPMS